MFYGLAPGEYTLTEYEAPTGYDKIDDVINVEVKFEKPTADWVCGWNYTVTYEDKDGNSISSASVQSSTANGVCELFVENLTTHTLPSTGGIGTTVFYVAGSLLATAAGVMLVAKKRARKEEEADAE
jgi:LPXTG-motif cell wall-anchored protein